MSYDSRLDPTPEEIEKMLEESQMKTVPSHILKGFKEDVLRRIEADRPVKSGRWISSGWKLPRVGLSVGAGAFACLIIASLAVLTMDKPAPQSRPALQVASVPAAPAMLAAAAPQARAFDKMVSVAAPESAAAPAPVKRRLTVEEELRLIEEFDDQRFFIRQDVTDDVLAQTA